MAFQKYFTLAQTLIYLSWCDHKSETWKSKINNENHKRKSKSSATTVWSCFWLSLPSKSAKHRRQTNTSSLQDISDMSENYFCFAIISSGICNIIMRTYTLNIEIIRMGEMKNTSRRYCMEYLGHSGIIIIINIVVMWLGWQFSETWSMEMTRGRQDSCQVAPVPTWWHMGERRHSAKG